MKLKKLHTSFLSTWQILICLLMCNSIYANSTSDVLITAYLDVKKSIVCDFHDKSKPSGSEFPADSNDENNVKTIDYEEITESYLLNKFTTFIYFPYNDTLVIINYKESNNLQFLLDIVAPPPKC